MIIPAERMKMRRVHVVPLAPFSVALIREQMARVGGHGYLFPNRNDRSKPMSDGAINKGLEQLGYAGRQTGHGFRHIFSTELNERGYPEDYVDAQLAHKKKGTAGVYNKAAYLKQRRAILEAWANDIASMIETTSPAIDPAH